MFLTLFIGTLAWSQLNAAEFLPATADGWHTWRIDEAGPVARMCCFSRRRGARTHTGCDLDGRHVSFSNNDDCVSEAGVVQIFARFRNGEPVVIRALSSSCPVSAKTEITDHGLISIAENVAWFRSVIENRQLAMDVREDALFVLVQSESDAAFDYLDTLLAER